MGVNSSPYQAIIVDETKNICLELNRLTGAIWLSTGEIGIFLDSRVNPIPKLAPTGSNRYLELFLLSILLNNNPLF